MAMTPHLAAMRRSMMLGDAAPSMEMRASRRSEFAKAPASNMIAALKTALRQERQARIAAEARLRSVLDEIGRQATRRRAPIVAAPNVPARAAVVETEAVETTPVHTSPVSNIHMAILDVGGDEGEEEETNGF